MTQSQPLFEESIEEEEDPIPPPPPFYPFPPIIRDCIKKSLVYDKIREGSGLEYDRYTWNFFHPKIKEDLDVAKEDEHEWLIKHWIDVIKAYIKRNYFSD